MKKLFLAIRHEEIDTVRELLDKKPELIACAAKVPPKKDEGQSPLQVALKTQAFDIVDLLLDRGADVNALDSFGNPGLWRFASQAAQILPSYDRGNQRITRDRLITEDLRHDLSRISALLTAHGADPSFRKPALNNLTLRELYHDQPVLAFLP